MRSNNKHFLLLIFFCLCTTAGWGQLPNYTLRADESGANKAYVATDFISMKPGFSYKASGSTTFSAKINDPQFSYVPTPTSNTYAKPDGTITTDPTQGAVVGNIPGNASVSPTGGATYQIPIEVPTGVNGMQPQVSITYNSQGGFGALGAGWDISGSSVITRGAKTQYFDGQNNTIKFDNTDALYLDGQRLVLLSGSPFTVGAVYGTEIENYTRVTVTASSVSAICFVLTTKDGKIMEYGNSANSLLMTAYDPTDVRVLAWKLNKVTDTYGNFMTYTYSGYGQYLSHIDYAGQSVQFTYNLDMDYPKKRFFNSFMIYQRYLLSSVTTKAGTSTLKTFGFNYMSSTDTRLISVSETASDGTKVNSTSINWGDESIELNSQIVGSNITNTVGDNGGSIYSGDVNNDGYDDQIEFWAGSGSQQGHILVRLFNPATNTYNADNNGAITYFDYYDPDIYKPQIIISDINNDKQNEIILFNRGKLFTYKFNNNLISLINTIDVNNYFNKYRNIKMISGDLNHDNYNDIIIVYDSHDGPDGPGEPNNRYDPGYMLYKGGASGLSYFDSWFFAHNLFTSLKTTNNQLGDFDANGSIDIMAINPYSTGGFVWDKDSNGNDLPIRYVMCGTYGQYNKNDINYTTCDFNGDGLSDILSQSSSDHTWKLLENTGDYYNTPTIKNLPIYAASNVYSGERYQTYVIDYNGDGLTDFVLGDETFSGDNQFVNTKWYFYKNINGNLTLEFIKTSNNRIDKMYGFVADVNGDGVADLVLPIKNDATSTYTYIAYTMPNATRHNLVTSITNGMGLTDSFEYSQFSNYDQTTETNPQLRNVKSPMTIVNSHTNPDGSITNYKFENPQMHTDGKGFLGFMLVTESNLVKGRQIITEYEVNTTYFNVCLKSQTVATYNGLTSLSLSLASVPPLLKTISTLTQINAVIDAVNKVDQCANGQKRFIPIVLTQTNIDELKKTQQITTFDYNLYPGSITQTTTYGYKNNTNIDLTSRTVTVFTGPNNKIPYLPQTITTTQTQDGQSITRTTGYGYTFDTTNPYKIIQSTITNDPGDINQVVTTYSNYDTWGHPQSISAVTNGKTRSSTITYTPTGRFVSSKTNESLNQTTTYDWDEIRGLLNSETDYRNNSTSYRYDGWGSLIGTRYPTGIRTTQVLQWASQGSPLGAKYSSYSQTAGVAPTTVWYDALGREIQSDTYGLNNRKISVSTEYYTTDTYKGRLYRVSEPYFAEDAGSKIWSKTYAAYDDYGRPTLVTTPLGNVTTVYSGLITTVTTPEGTTETTLNSAGQTTISKVNGKAVNYAYYASGLTKTSTPEGGQAITMVYNLQGNRTKLYDPDGGFIRSEYNGFGELTKEVQRVHLSGDSITTINTYKPDGRLESISRNGEVTNYIYDSSFKDRVNSISIANKNTQTFGFDAYDRVTGITETITANGTTKTYVLGKEYDSYGRISKETYPSGYYSTNTYDGYGNLTEIKDMNNRSVWRANLENARGQLTSISKGTKTTTYGYDSNGMPTSISALNVVDMAYHFTANGNLEYRTDNRTSQQEQFMYDGLNRLTNWNIYQNGGLAKENSHVYDPTTGNISTRTNFDITKSMAYGGNRSDGSAIGAHALATIAGTPGDISLDDLTVTYTDFKKIKTLTEGSKTYSISYGVDDQRRVSVQTVNGVTTTRYYIGDYEEVITGSVIKKIHYLSGAIFIQETNQPDKFYYSYADYQGSLIALTDENGIVVEKYAYDPWGVRRNPDNWTQRDSRTTWIVNRGYTGHEHLDAFGIINMNGRVYDPSTGMFFSPDPNLQAPGDWLNYNRYSYCMGNPLKYIDPSGNSWFSNHWKSIVTTVASIGVGIGVGVLTGGMGLVAAGMLGGSASGFTSGVLGSALNGGNLSQVLNSGMQGAIIGGVAGMAGGGAAQWMTGIVGTSVGGFAAGAAIGVTGGAAGGFAGGSLGAWMNDASFEDGIMAGLKGAGIGAAAGGLIGGIIRGIGDSRKGSDVVLTKEDLLYDTGTGMSEEEIEAFSLKELGVREGDWGISDITLKSSSGYRYDPDKYLFINSKGESVAGYTKPNFWNGKVSVHISTRATMNPIFLKGVMIHEYTHAYHFFKGYNTLYGSKIFRNSTENAAINAERNYYESFNSQSSYALRLIENCNLYQQQFIRPHPIPWSSPFSGFKVVF